MDGIFRRPSGIYVARLMVPARLRQAVGKIELLKSTGHRNSEAAKVVGAEILARWRRWLHDFAHLADPNMDLERVALGNPALALGGHLRINDAASASGLDVSDILRAAKNGELDLFMLAHSWPGYELLEASLLTESFDSGRGLVIPNPSEMPPDAVSRVFTGHLRVHRDDLALVASALETTGRATIVAYQLAEVHGRVFVPDDPKEMTPLTTQVAVSQVESLRRKAAQFITDDQLANARASAVQLALRQPEHGKPNSRASEAVTAYMKVRRLNCNDDQARRVQAALNLFVELTCDPFIGNITSDFLDNFRDRLLTQVPSNENKVRLQFGSSSVTESIAAVEGKAWQRISVTEQVKRLQWLSAMFIWLMEKNWIPNNPAKSLINESGAKAKANKDAERDQDARQSFSRDHLNAIFSGAYWFVSGRGQLTKADTYRDFAPYYFWLPLLGLYTGARINELSQLHLTDIKSTEAGTHYFDIATLNDPDGKKRRKNSQSLRRLPIHPHLIRLGLLEWRDRLASAGYTRLFPELKHDAIKGYGKAATKWFSRYLSGLGWDRTGQLVFHSFRSTLVNECDRSLQLSLIETAQLTGHREGMKSALARHYLKDRDIDQLLPTVSKIDFELPEIARFDIDAGIKAVSDALARKDKGRGADED